MIERFTIPPDAKARLAMRDRRESSHEANSRWPLASPELTGDSPHTIDECEADSPSADLG